MTKFGATSGQADLRSDIPIEASGGQVWYYFEQADLWSDVPPWERHLMAKFGTTLVRCTPQVQTSLGQVWYYFKQVDLWPDVPPTDLSWPSLVLTLSRLIFGQMNPHCLPPHLHQPPPSASTPAPTLPLVETSCDQVWYYFGQMYPTPGRDISWSSIVLIHLDRLTFVQTFFHSISNF